jgi:hypothetical protein
VERWCALSSGLVEGWCGGEMMCSFRVGWWRDGVLFSSGLRDGVVER